MSDNNANSTDTVPPMTVGLRNGFRIEFIRPGSFSPSFLDSRYANQLVGGMNALLNAKIIRVPAPVNQDGTADTSAGVGRVIWSDTNVIIELYDSAAGGSGTGNMNYRGDYDNTITYAFGDVVRIRPGTTYALPGNPSGADIGAYVNILACTGVVPASLFQSGGENSHWAVLPDWTVPAGSGSSSQELYFFQAFGNYIVCKDGSGNYFPVVKHARLRHAVTSEKIDNVTWSYTYTHDPGGSKNTGGGSPLTDPLCYQYREAQAGATTEYQMPNPSWLAASTQGAVNGTATADPVICTTYTPLSGITKDSYDTLCTSGQFPPTLIEVGPRAWAKLDDQTFGA